MKNKIIITALAAIVLSPFSAFAEKPKSVSAETAVAETPTKKTSTPAGWTDDFEGAKKQATKEGKDLFVVFSGTDWCGWCIRLEKDILNQDGFLEGVSEHFVPVFIDRPRDKELLSELGKKQNEKLCDDYRIQGFPTVLLMDAEGDVFGKTGYANIGAKKYLEKVATLTETGKASAEYKALKAISALPEGPNRIKQLDELLSALPLDVQIVNSNYVDEVLAADLDGSRGFRAKYPYFTTVRPLESQVQQEFLNLSRLMQKEVARVNPQGESAARIFALEKSAPAFAELLAKIKKAQGEFDVNSIGGKRLNDMALNIGVLFKKFGVELPKVTTESK